MLQTIDTNRKNRNSKHDSGMQSSIKEKAISPKTQFQIDREKGIIESARTIALRRKSFSWNLSRGSRAWISSFFHENCERIKSKGAR